MLRAVAETRAPPGVAVGEAAASLDSAAQSVAASAPAWLVSGFTPLAFAAAVVSVGFALVMWRSRRAPGALALLVLALGAAWWSFTYGLEQSVSTLAVKLLLGRLSYLGIVAVPVAWFAFALAYTGRREYLTRPAIALLAAPAVVAVVLPWTSGTNDLFWATTTLEAGGTGQVLALTYGPLFWVWSTYAYVLLAAGTVLLLRAVPTGARVFRAQTALLVVGVGAPWLANLTYLLRVSPGALDFTPIAFVGSALALGEGLRRYRLFAVHPAARAVARDELVERMAEPVVVLTPGGLVIDLNASARSVLGIEGTDPVGAALSSVAPDLAEVLPDGRGESRPDPRNEVGVWTTDDPTRHYEVRVTPLSDDGAGNVGRLVTLRDVTERRRRELRLAVLNRVLRHDLRNDLSVMAGYARLLCELDGAEEYATVISERAGGALDLVETVRDVERTLEAGAPTRSEIDLVRVVDEQVATARRAHPEADVETALPAAGHVLATDLVSSVVDNLVENAIEHNDTETPQVRVSVERVEREGRPCVELRVADDGPPIPERDRAVLVGEDDATLDEASGLGLWLVNWIVTESGGEVEHEANEPRGNVVVVRLPAADPGDGEGDGAAPDPDARSTGRRIPVERPRRSGRPADATGSRPRSAGGD